MMRFSVQWQDGCGEWVHFAARDSEGTALEVFNRLHNEGRTVRIMELRPKEEAGSIWAKDGAGAKEWYQLHYREGGK